MSSQLDALRTHTTVVADTGDFATMRAHTPTDATTNPSLILQAVQQPQYAPLLDTLVRRHPNAPLHELLDRVLVTFGTQILQIVPGRVSTEVDARLSFDTRATIERARGLIALYEQTGIARSRVLIKIASTWEGIQAARVLQAEDIRCNMTLLFSLHQAIACADAGAQLISPFVGRIYDWHKMRMGSDWVDSERIGARDPGVESVKRIFHYYKAHDIKTEIMGASFRNVDQILALSGCDLLTISPALLAQLDSTDGDAPVRLCVEAAKHQVPARLHCDEVTFRTALNADAMAHDKLSEGIRTFVADSVKLDALISARKTA